MSPFQGAAWSNTLIKLKDPQQQEIEKHRKLCYWTSY